MSASHLTAPQAQPREAAPPDLYAFTLDFFAFFNAPVRRLDRRKQGPLEVDLPPELADYFGKPQLRLAFHHAGLGDEFDLVAYGSRLFDRMQTLLAQRGALTFLALPNRHTGSEELMHAVKPVNASITGLKLQEQARPLYIFNWRITYRADDKREELYTVAVDDQGERLSLAGAAQDAPDPSALDLDALLADAQPIAPEVGPDGLPLPPRLPALSQLVRMAETARKYAIYHADLRCVSHEAEILPRLYQTLNRLTTYYGQQIQEVYDSHDPTGEKRRGLELDLERKIAEEVENHRLRVQVTLYSYALLQTPVAVADLTLSDGKREAALQLVRNRYTGAIQRAVCHACGQATTSVALDQAGHLCCDACTRQCAACQEIVCAECGVEPCPVCGAGNCATCGRVCWACGGRACAGHAQPCPVCGDTVCLACQSVCAHCGKLQCRSHLRADGVAAADGSHPLICPDCAVRCPGCRQYSAELGVCGSSGQRFCANCLVTCAGCRRQVGPGFYEKGVGGKAYCHDCLVECPTCHALTAETTACAICGTAACSACSSVCRVCGRRVCAEHIRRYDGCSHPVCTEHGATCAICRSDVCPVCLEACAICGQAHCDEHSDICRRCEQVYCRACVKESGLCLTCAGLERDGVPLDLTAEPWVADERVAALAPHYRWRRLSNARYWIFVGENSFLSRAVVVVRRGQRSGQVVSARRLGAVDRLRDQFGI